MQAARLAGRTWTRRDLALSAILLFIASIGMVFRTTLDEILAVIPAPEPVIALLFAGYCTVVSCIVYLLLMRRARSPLPAAVLWAFVTAVALGIAVLVVLTPASVDVRADRDDALDIAVHQLLSGASPWAVPTQLGDQSLPSPLLGGILLALPFVLILGSSALQGAFWLTVGAFAAARWLGIRVGAALVLLLMASPILLNELVFQSDLWVNATVLAIAILWGWAAATGRSTHRRFALAASALLLGLGLADRFFFAVVVIPSAALLWRAAGPRVASWWCGSAVALAVALVVTPWLLIPGSISQTLHNVGKASSDVVPHSALLLAGLMLAISALLTWQARSLASHFMAMAAPLVVLCAWESLLASLAAGRLVFNGMLSVSYAAAFLVFGVLALVLPVDGSANPRRP